MAEGKVGKTIPAFSNLSIDEARALFHDVEVHQIELEMQNQELREIQNRLEEARDQYANLFDFAPVGYILLNEKGIIKNINLTACKMLGKDRLHFKEKPFSAYLPQKESKKLFLKLKEIFQTGNITPFELEINHQNTGTFPVLINGNLAYQDTDRNSICHFSIQDITEIRKSELLQNQIDALQREKKTVQKYLDLAPVIFLLIDKDQKVQMLNKKGSTVLGYSQKELAGREWFKDFVAPQGINGENFTYYNFEKKSLLWVPDFECEVVCKNGEKKLIAWRSSTIFDNSGEILATLCAGEDITWRKKLEINKQEYTDELEELIRHRTKKLSAALKKERQLNEMKSAFISIASHELRTPITIIMTSTILIEKYLQAKLFENQQKHIDKIKTSVKNFSLILDDFLSLDKLERGIVIANKDQFDFKEFIKLTIQEIEEICKKNQKINFTFTGSTQIVSDKKILRNILINLLSNAIKYSEKDIQLDVTHSHYLFIMKVKDKGIGICKEEQKYLFTRFFRASNTNNIPGTGLGLSIVKRYVELLGGSIKFKSEQNIGSTFTVSLPQENSL